MNSRTLKAKTTQGIASEIEKVITDDFKPTLAIVFISVKQNIKSVCDELDNYDISIFGATTSGEFIDGDIEEGSIAIMLLDMNPNYFKLKFIETNLKTTFDDAKKLGELAKDTFANPALILATGGIFIDGEQVVDGVMDSFKELHAKENKDLSLFGGMAGDDLIAEKPLVFTNGISMDNALIGLIIDQDKIDVKGVASCGWKAVGTSKTVTKSDGNIVYTIDDKPALDMLIKYLGVEIKPEEHKDVAAFLNSWYYPLQIERDNGDTVIRATRFANSKDRSLICTGGVPQGSKVKFSLPPDFDAIETLVSECESIKDNNAQTADALLMFSCISRHLSFGELIKEEIEQVKNIWDAPMVGFFTYGEYGRSINAANEFHNNACCIIALKEK